MNNTEESQCRIRRTGIVQAMDQAFVQADVEGKRIAIPLSKCAPSIRVGNRIAWNGKQWIDCEPDV